MLQTNGTCPHCGTEVKDYREYGWEYGSPIRKCEKCGNNYINKGYHEIAVEGIAPDEFDAKKSVHGILLGLAIVLGAAAATAAITWATIHFANVYYVKIIILGVVLAVIGLIFAVCMFIDFLKIKSGAKERKFDSLKEESVQRLKNKEYARELAEIGYDVPEQYLK